MGKSLQMKVGQCSVCPLHMQHDGVDFCVRAAREIEVVWQIPEWCPLPDAPEEGEG